MSNDFIKFLAGFNFFILSLIFFSYASQPRLDLSGEYRPHKKTAYFCNEKCEVPTEAESRIAYEPVLGETTGQKKIFIDLTNQRLYAFQGNQLVYNFLVSTGKWGRTPTGLFQIWVKLRYTLMSGGSKELNTYYYLPNVPYVMYFYNDRIPKIRGYGIHGTYWHNNFGHPMSHGCINMKTEEVAQLYHWAEPDLRGRSSIYASSDNPGTPVIIFGTAPF